MNRDFGDQAQSHLYSKFMEYTHVNYLQEVTADPIHHGLPWTIYPEQMTLWGEILTKID